MSGAIEQERRVAAFFDIDGTLVPELRWSGDCFAS